MTECLLKFNKEFLDFVDKFLKPKISRAKVGFEIIALFLFAKATKTFRAIVFLCENKLGEDAAILTRSLLEDLITLAYIDQDREHRTELYRNYLLIETKRKSNQVKQIKDSKSKFNNWDNIFNPEEYKEAQRMHSDECNRIDKRKKRNYSWSCKSIGEMSKEINLYDPYYIKVHWILCQLSHPSSMGLGNYVEEDETGIQITDVPSENYTKSSLAISFDCYFKMVNLMNNIFNLGLSSDIKKMEKKFISLFSSSIA